MSILVGKQIPREENRDNRLELMRSGGGSRGKNQNKQTVCQSMKPLLKFGGRREKKKKRNKITSRTTNAERVPSRFLSKGPGETRSAKRAVPLFSLSCSSFPVPTIPRAKARGVGRQLELSKNQKNNDNPFSKHSSL